MPNLAIATVLNSYGGSNRGIQSGDPIGASQLPIGSPKDHQRITNWKGVKLLYIGSRAKLDRELVESAGIKFKSIFTGKLRRYFSWQNFIDPFFVIIGFFQSIWIIIRFWPDVVFSKGGFVSVPACFAAFVLRRPIILHEADSVMGLANRIVSKFAKKICVSFPNVQMSKLPNVQTDIQISKRPNPQGTNQKVIFTGNPIRTSIKNGNPDKGYKITGFRKEKPVVLLWGGSQGAKEINDIIFQEFEALKKNYQIIHITGKGKQMEIKDESYVQYEYIGEELKHIYSITDIVVGRAGANSLYELAFVQKPNILIPLQNADQINNAAYFEAKGASIVLREKSLHEVLNALWHNSDKMRSMKEALGDIAKPGAAEEIAEIIFQIVSK